MDGATNNDPNLPIIEYAVERITPNPNCRYCHGLGEIDGDWVPYGMGNAQLPADFCDCVTSQLQNEDSEIELTPSDAVLKRYADAQAIIEELY